MRIGSGLRDAMRDWGYEVDAEAKRLIERGTPPWEAIETARNNISRRRREAATTRDIESKRQGCGDHDPLP